MSTPRKIGVIGAMASEVALVKEAMAAEGPVNTTRVGDLEFHEGTASGVPVAVVQCGVGMVNAACCTETLVDRFGVDAVINTGVAGSLDDRIDIGDVLIATDAVNHVMDATNLGYAPGQTPDLDVLAFPADEGMRQAAEAVATQLGMRAHTGRVASGDRFVCDPADRARIASTFGARCCEMEGAAIAQVCHLAHTPCLIVRAISDKADGTSDVDYPQFEAKAARDCASLVLRLLPQIE